MRFLLVRADLLLYNCSTCSTSRQIENVNTTKERKKKKQTRVKSKLALKAMQRGAERYAQKISQIISAEVE